jgi:hypothetical protein
MTTRRDLIAQRAVAMALARPASTPPPTKRSRRTMRCRMCGGLGHNSRGCNEQPTKPEAAPTPPAPDVVGFEDVQDFEVGHSVALRGEWHE